MNKEKFEILKNPVAGTARAVLFNLKSILKSKEKVRNMYVPQIC
jgi:hypothetical protein